MQDDLLFKRLLIALLAQEYHRVLAVNAAHMRRWRAKNPERSRELTKQTRARHPETRNLRNRFLQSIQHNAHVKDRDRVYRLAGPERRRAKNKVKWRAMTPEQRTAYRAYQNDWVKNRCKTDPVFRMMRSFRCRLAIFLTRPYRKSGMNDLIGCTGHELRAHIESLFQPGMSWENYGRTGWHIDHRVGVVNFDLNDPEQLKKAWHFTNLQPLWMEDNLTKPKRLDIPLAPAIASCESTAVTSAT